jgi:hypothetical protein
MCESVFTSSSTDPCLRGFARLPSTTTSIRTSTLTLNNNQSEATDVKITFYNSKGEPFQLSPISLPGLQISRFNVRGLTKEARGNFKSGSAQVFYHGPGMGIYTLRY